jgi:hypothetical protein
MTTLQQSVVKCVLHNPYLRRFTQYEGGGGSVLMHNNLRVGLYCKVKLQGGSTPQNMNTP